MVEYRNPEGVKAPGGPYSHVAEIKSGKRLLFISGQVGVDANGNLPESAEEQAINVYRNLEAILRAEGLGIDNILKTTTYLVGHHLAEATSDFA